MKRNLTLAIMMLLVAAAAITFCVVVKANENTVADSVVKKTDCGEKANVSDIQLPHIEYHVRKDMDAIYGEVAQLCATIDGKEVVIGTIDYIFGPDNLDNMEIFAQEDFDGDGINDALVCDANIGSGGGSVWTFITYAGNSSFKKSSLFSEFSYYVCEISTVDGKKVLDFTKMDLGQRVVKERHGLKDGEAISLEPPHYELPAYNVVKSFIMDNLENGDFFHYDLNGDGKYEKLTTTDSYHFGRGFELDMNGEIYDFSVGALWGNGIFHILESITNGMHDIMIESDTRDIYKWDGTSYTSDTAEF